MRSPAGGPGRLGRAFLAVTAVYVVVVLGGGLLIGHTDSPHVGLSILATAIVALGLEPLRSWLEAVAKRWVQGDRATPYDVLSRFSESLTGEIEPGRQAELPLRMARLLAEGTGARWAQVWLVVDDEPELAAAWPQESASRTHGTDDGRARPALARRHARRRAARHPAPAGAPRPAAVAGRGAPVRRPRGPGGPGASRCSAARRAGAAGRRPGDPGRGPPGLAPTRRRHPRLRAAAPGARHPRRGPAAPGRARGQPPPRPHPDRDGRPTERERCSPSREAPSTTRSRAWSTSRAGSIRRSSPRTASPRRCATSWAPAPSRSRSSTTGSAGRTPSSRRPCTSAASRRCRTPSSTPPPAGSRSSWRPSVTGSSCSCATTGTASTSRPSSRPAGWATCATGWTRWAATSTVRTNEAGGTDVVVSVRRRGA